MGVAADMEGLGFHRQVVRSSVLLICASLVICAVLGSSWEKRLHIDQPSLLLLGAAPQETATAKSGKGKAQASQKIRENNGIITAEYGFQNFNSDHLSVSFSIPARELAAYKGEYGYTQAERKSLDEWQKSAIDSAYKNAVNNGHSQEQLNRASEKIAAEYKERMKSFYMSRGFSLEGKLLKANIPEIVRRNVRHLRPIAIAINNQGEKHGYDGDSLIAAALSLVQTAVSYETVPLDIAGRQTGGIYPPMEAITRGGGDCDTKTALLGSILLNWGKLRLIGIGVPGHYLMGILRNPAKGDAFVEYKGLRYVLMEPAGPGWLPPGTIDQNTAARMNAEGNLKIELFTSN